MKITTVNMTRLVAFVAALTLVLACVSPAPAQQVTTLASISGVTKTSGGAAISGAVVTLIGKSSAHTRSDSRGSFAFNNLSPGLYEIVVTAPAFETLSQSNIALIPGDSITLSFTLSPASFSSLQVITRVTSSAGRSINTSPAAVTDISSQTFLEQGNLQVTSVLNQTPGIITTVSGYLGTSNGSLGSTAQVPQIRGALPYETESLIDGHPLSVGSNGYFSPLLINPNFLTDVEVVKGPGSMPVDINYAVGGSINYRTLEPTAKASTRVALDMGNYGGLSTTVTSTGTTPNGRLGWAAGYSSNGSPEALTGYPMQSSTLQFSTGTVTANGAPLCGPSGTSGCPRASGPGLPGFQSSTSTLLPIVTCCDTSFSDAYNTRSELAKLRYSFSQPTSLTVAFLGAQEFARIDQTSYNALQIFSPLSGYAGSIPAGTVLGLARGFAPLRYQETDGLLEAELRTSLGKDTMLFRYYTGVDNNTEFLLGGKGGPAYTYSADTWGALPIGTGGSKVNYNGQPVTYTITNGGFTILAQDRFSGYSAELVIPDGDNTFTIAADRTAHSSARTTAADIASLSSSSVPPGSSQAFTTLSGRAALSIAENVTANLALYAIDYDTHYTPTGGKTWADAEHAFIAPRMALTWQPKSGTSYRFSAGSSIAPPYLTLVSTAGGAPVPNNGGAANYYTQTVNSGQVLPETSFGYDLGSDRHVGKSGIASLDLYVTNLQNQFLTAVTQNGTYTPSSGVNAGISAPLYISTTLNLGHSRYEGVEFSYSQAPARGLGYKAQGSLERAYVYDLPANFYNTAAGSNLTNLAVIPYINFQPSGNGYNGMSNRVPYSMGYGELNFRSGTAYYRVGGTYYGPNNWFNAPAFWDVSASARWQLLHGLSVQIAADNIFNALGAEYYNSNGGIPVPLVNGKVGAVSLVNLGPTTWHLTLRRSF